MKAIFQRGTINIIGKNCDGIPAVKIFGILFYKIGRWRLVKCPALVEWRTA